MTAHKVIAGGYGPGTYVDVEFLPLPEDCERILSYLTEATPGFPAYDPQSNVVEFIGSDLSIIPGPVKAQAMVC